jgi:two-component system, sensor histidine kinase and response regulator
MAPRSQIMPTRSAEHPILVIDDDEIMRVSCGQILKKAGYWVETFSNGPDGISRLRQVKPAVLVVDIKMPEPDGFEVINIVRKIDNQVTIVVITGYATVDTAIDAMRAGAYDFLPKPFTPNELRLIIDRGYERFRLAKEAERLRREKEEVERKFVALVSHQLKSPLVAVKQYLDVLLFSSRDQLPEKAVEWISRSQLRLGEMLNIIRDWLAIAKIDRGVLCDRNVTTDIGQIVRDTVREQQPQSDASDLVIHIEMAPDLPRVSGDPLSISMLVGNLISNAIKYNRRGGSVKISATSDGKNVSLGVSDTGLGISEECIPHLFQEFYRINTPETQEIPGTGLGLVICKRILDELGGSVEVRSKIGEGTVFLVLLLVAEKESAADPPSLSKTAPGDGKRE